VIPLIAQLLPTIWDPFVGSRGGIDQRDDATAWATAELGGRLRIGAIQVLDLQSCKYPAAEGGLMSKSTRDSGKRWTPPQTRQLRTLAKGTPLPG
jgi:hypothetical protein